MRTFLAAATSMNRRACFALCALAAALFAAPSALAQQADWTDPQGRYSLNYSFHGWVAASSSSATVRLSLIHPRFRAMSGRERGCFVTEDAVSGQVTGEAEQDAWLAGLNTADVERIIGRAVSEFSQGRVDGRAVIDYASTNGAYWLRTRVFRLSDGTNVVHVTIVCGGEPPFTDEERTSFESVISSLRFLPAGAP